mgnify:FL=1
MTNLLSDTVPMHSVDYRATEIEVAEESITFAGYCSI